MLEDIQTFIRTSLRKNPEEWTFLETIEGSGKIISYLNIFEHLPTKYILCFMHLPYIESEIHGEIEESFYADFMPGREYAEIIKENEGVFSPSVDRIFEVNKESSITATLMYIKELSLEQQNIARYEKFKVHVQEKTIPKPREERLTYPCRK